MNTRKKDVEIYSSLILYVTIAVTIAIITLDWTSPVHMRALPNFRSNKRKFRTKFLQDQNNTLVWHLQNHTSLGSILVSCFSFLCMWNGPRSLQLESGPMLNMSFPQYYTRQKCVSRTHISFSFLSYPLWTSSEWERKWTHRIEADSRQLIV